MKKPILASESRIILNLMQSKWGIATPPSNLILHGEWYHHLARNHKKPYFNSDFTLEFFQKPYTDSRDYEMAGMLPGHPGKTGGEIILMIGKESLQPLRLELMFGGYGRELCGGMILEIKQALAKVDAVADPSRNFPEWEYSRISLINGEISFLLCRHDRISELRQMKATHYEEDRFVVDCYAESENIICFDGWIKAGCVGSSSCYDHNFSGSEDHMRIGPLRTYVMVLRGEDPQVVAVSVQEKARALERLKAATGQDFGYDSGKWEQWLKANKPQDYF